MPSSSEAESIVDHEPVDGGDGIRRGPGRETCATCDGWVDPSEWHPIRLRSDGSGPDRIDVFCSEHCQEATADGPNADD